MPTTSHVHDMIVLTTDLSDLEIVPPPSSSAKRPRPGVNVQDKSKRPKQAPLAKVEYHHHQHHNHQHRQAKLIGEAWRVEEGLLRTLRDKRKGQPASEKGKESYYRAVQCGKMLIQVDSLITCNHKAGDTSPRGVVRRIVKRKFDTGNTEITSHVHWLGPSDCGQPQEVFLKHKSCSDIKLREIRQVQPLDIRPQHPPGDHRFLQHVYEHAYEVWRDPVLVNLAGNPVCDSCHTAKKVAPRRVNDSWVIDGVSYHRHDFVLFEDKKTPASASLVWQVAQIVQVKRDGFIVQLLTRYADWAKIHATSAGYMSEKRLMLTGEERRISPHEILYKAHVTFDQHVTIGPIDRSFFCRDRLVDNKIIPLTKALRCCTACVDLASKEDRLYRDFKERTTLPAIDYYSGGGGGMIGGRGFFKHAHAVEMDGHACETLEANFPETTVHCCLVSDAHDAALGRNKHHLIDRRDAELEGQRRRRKVRSLPEAGLMVLASAGPPCQGHTGANHQNQVADVRNDELFVTINEIGRLRPDIFILENVPMMKRDRDGADAAEVGNFAVEGIKRLRRLGYQVRLVQLDSRSYGSPQNRTRLFIICARKGVPLPSIPEPTHANPELGMNIFDSGGAVTSRSFYVGTKGEPGSGPLPPVTVRDAISDLPRWEYTHHSVTAQRGARRIPQFLASTGGNPSRVGYLNPVPYSHPPTNDYQASQRGGASTISNHYTPPRSERELQLVVDAHTVTNAKIPGNARRTNPDAGAYTLLTTSGPGGKYTGPIHYDQVRTLTVAERKRIQGVPDAYILVGNVHDKDRQVGNMINVHLSRALHGHIHREVFFKAWLEMGRPDDFLARWRASHPI